MDRERNSLGGQFSDLFVSLLFSKSDDVWENVGSFISSRVGFGSSEEETSSLADEILLRWLFFGSSLAFMSSFF